MTDQELQAQYGGQATTGTMAPPVNSAYQPSVQNVYSPANVQQTMTAPIAAPDYSDPFKLRDYFYNSPDVVAARGDVKKLTDSINSFDTGTTNNQNYLENQTAAMGVITGQKANDARLRAGTRDSLARELLAKQSYLDSATNEANAKYQIAQESRSQLQNLITQTGGKAGISYADTYETALQKATKYQKKQADEQAKDEYKKQLKAVALQLGIKTSGKNTKALEKSLRKAYKSDREYEQAVKHLELKAKQIAVANAGRGSESTASTVIANAGSNLQRGQGGYVDFAKYQQEKDSAVRSGKLTPADFDAQYGYLLSGDDQRKFGIAGSNGVQTNEAQQTAQKALTLANTLKSSSALNRAVGPIQGKYIPTLLGDTADFESNFNSLKSLLTLDNLGKLKGVLSDSDMKVLQNAATSLNLGMSETGFKNELDNVRNVLSAKLGLSSPDDPLGIGL